ncbi:DUF3891 family protein [Ammoniphilus sp. CFH 90114]|uniref:DUF3891 family protein n=1 Tax=Ammoniphilus sp. CFH 90114 TaxID=2493665 RepID=UPI00100FEEF8|nr:DUF3891 family protein [Ammoniphilus sp. CFH 90114]RXT03783.1 DUF3891 family protein [Ammoniphilus sp. CFH 90114]
MKLIVYEKEKTFVLITQHDHAQVSGDIMSAWKSDWLNRDERRADLIYAAYQHDRGWIDLDQFPLWNDAKNQPFTFFDFPAKIRFQYYVKGLDEVEQVNEYAALLCSLLYTALAKRFINEDTMMFIHREQLRQTRLKKRVDAQEEKLKRHLNALVLCDELSLFVCMQPPGTPRNQYEWFAKGLHFSFPDFCDNVLVADWMGDQEVQLKPFPFGNRFEITIPFKEVDKVDVSQKGVVKSYAIAQTRQLRVTLEESTM